MILLIFLVLFGVESAGSKRWISFGFFSIQPSEFTKIFLVLAITRNSLLDEWKLQIDDELPNHFLINVSKDQVKGIENLIKDEKLFIKYN